MELKGGTLTQGGLGVAEGDKHSFQQKCLLGGKKSEVPGVQDKREKDYYRQREHCGEGQEQEGGHWDF